MMSEMTTNSQISTMEPKTKKTKRSKLDQDRTTEKEITWRVISGEEEGENGVNRYR